MSKRTRSISYRVAQLSPYPGEVRRFRSWADLRGHYEKHVGPYPYTDDEPKGGRFIFVENVKDASKCAYLIYGAYSHVFVHELSHCVLHLFKRIGIDPREANGEPFCYLISQLMITLSWQND